MDVNDWIRYIMENYPETKDNDLKLFCKFMNMFYHVEISITQLNKMLEWPSFASIIRERSRIQNTLKQLVPSEQVIKSRHQSQTKYRDKYWPLYKNDF